MNINTTNSIRYTAVHNDIVFSMCFNQLLLGVTDSLCFIEYERLCRANKTPSLDLDQDTTVHAPIFQQPYLTTEGLFCTV